MNDVIIVGVTREIVQPAKASNFSENRLLKRASPYDTETIYQLLFISSMYHYSFFCLRMLVFELIMNNVRVGKLSHQRN